MLACQGKELKFEGDGRMALRQTKYLIETVNIQEMNKALFKERKDLCDEIDTFLVRYGYKIDKGKQDKNNKCKPMARQLTLSLRHTKYSSCENDSSSTDLHSR